MESDTSLAEDQQQLQFLLTCHDYGLIPDNLKSSTNNEQLEQEALDNEISKIHSMIIEKKQEKEDEVPTLSEEVERKNSKKIKQLTAKLWETFNIKFNKEWFVNETAMDIPEDIQWLLSLGKDFALPMDRESSRKYQLISESENVINAINDKQHQILAREQYRNMLESYYRNLKPTSFAKYVLQVHKKAHEFLGKNTHILIIEADKGHATVAIHRGNNDEETIKLLSENTNFKIERLKNPAQDMPKNNKFVKELRKKQIIDDLEELRLTTYKQYIPTVYLVPRIHNKKTSFVLQSSPCFELYRYMADKLQSHAMKSKYSIKDSLDFVDKVKQLKLRENDVFVSFKLVTGIPAGVGLQHALPLMDEEIFNDILTFCLKANTYIGFNKSIYKQLQNLPMGNPLTPVVIDLVLDYFVEDSWTSFSWGSQKEPPFAVRYENEILTVMDSDKTERMLQSLNSAHHKIKFEMNEQTDETIEFLDVQIHNKNGELSFNWCQTDSGRLVNYLSNQPKHTIIEAAASLVRKVFALSDEKFHSDNVEKLTKILIANSYPIEVAKDLIDKRGRAEWKETEGERVSMLYVPKLAESFEREILSKTNNVRIEYKPCKTLASLFTDLGGRYEVQ